MTIVDVTTGAPDAPTAPAADPEVARRRDGTATLIATPQDKLAAALADVGLAGTSRQLREDRRAAALAKAQARVDQDRAWAACARLAEEAIADGAAVADGLARDFRELRPEVYLPRKTATEGAYAAGLLARTQSVDRELLAVRERFAPPALASPVTTVDAVNLRTNLALLEDADPQGAEPLVDDAIARGDQAFLDRAVLVVRRLQRTKERWQAGTTIGDLVAEATQHDAAGTVVARIVEKLDDATWSPDRAASAYANQRADRTARAWRALASMLVAKHRIDPVYRATGTFAPLLPATMGQPV